MRYAAGDSDNTAQATKGPIAAPAVSSGADWGNVRYGKGFRTRIALDAVLTYDLLVTIFSPNTPLHDGAVIIQRNRIIAAGCFLPLTLDPHLSKELGTRHRAAIGVTEETDAVAIVVSEETGTISAAIEGKITRNRDGAGWQSIGYDITIVVEKLFELEKIIELRNKVKF